MKKCAYCGKKIVSIPHTCKYCDKDFCSEQRLPESHDCPKENHVIPFREKETSERKSDTRYKPYARLWSVDFEPLIPKTVAIQPPRIVDPLAREESLHHLFMNSLGRELGSSYGLEISPGPDQPKLDVLWKVPGKEGFGIKKVGFEVKSRPKIKGMKELEQLYRQAESESLDYHWFSFLGNFGEKGKEITLLNLDEPNLHEEMKKTLRKLGVVEYHPAGKVRVHRSPQELVISQKTYLSQAIQRMDWKSTEGFVAHSVWNHFREKGNLVVAEITPPALVETKLGRTKGPFQKSENPWKGVKMEKIEPRVDITSMPMEYLEQKQLPQSGDYIGIECKGEQFSDEER
ncbi:hypothetical protein AKJ37_08020, partial [candidate division MSBL1 archaeon SCGC-AAA259I09]